jgi:phosphate transport system permease protein
MSEAAGRIAGESFDWGSEASARRRRRRHAADRRLQIYGYSAFIRTTVTYPVYVDPEAIDRENLFDSNWRALVREPLRQIFPDLPRRDERTLFDIPTSGAPFLLRDRVLNDPSLIGETISFTIPVSDPFDQLAKRPATRDVLEQRRRVSDVAIQLFDALEERGMISSRFNWGLFFNADSRFPELAGLAGAIVGSFYALLVTFIISFPLGIAAAIYLEEFAPKNRWTDLVEVNINNLAAVPSVVFGLLGLAVFLGWFGLPRSAPLVGGMVLSLMTLPTIIIATRAALKSVPPSIREAALGIGASKHEMILHHVLPLALPAIMTGTIIGLAQALGETAPLLLIGMNAFITNPPGGITDSATALPTQIFIWADSPERGFVALTSGAILVLLGFLIVMNGLAIFLRQRFERRW